MKKRSILFSFLAVSLSSALLFESIESKSQHSLTNENHYLFTKNKAATVLKSVTEYQQSKKALVKETNTLLSDNGRNPKDFMPDYATLKNNRMQFYDKNNKVYTLNVKKTQIPGLVEDFNQSLKEITEVYNVNLPTQNGISSLFNAIWSFDSSLSNTPANQVLTVRSFLSLASNIADFSDGITDIANNFTEFLAEYSSMGSAVTKGLSAFGTVTVVFDIIVSTASMFDNLAENGIHSAYDGFNFGASFFGTGLKLATLIMNPSITGLGTSIFGSTAAAGSASLALGYLAVPVTGLTIGVSALLGILADNKIKFRLGGAMISPYTDQPLKATSLYKYDAKQNLYYLLDQIPFEGKDLEVPPYVTKATVSNREITYERGVPAYHYYKRNQSVWTPSDGSDVTSYISSWKSKAQTISTNHNIESFVLPNTGEMQLYSKSDLTLLGWGVGNSDELSIIQRYLPDSYGIGFFATYADALKYINYSFNEININLASGITLLSPAPLPNHIDLYNQNRNAKTLTPITYNIHYTDNTQQKKQQIVIGKNYDYRISNGGDQLTLIMPEHTKIDVNAKEKIIYITIDGIKKQIDLSAHQHDFSIVTTLEPGVLHGEKYNHLMQKQSEFFQIQADTYQKGHYGQSVYQSLSALTKKHHLSGVVTIINHNDSKSHIWYDVQAHRLFINHFKDSGKLIGFIYDKTHQKIGTIAYQIDDGGKITVIKNDSYYDLKNNTLYKKTLAQQPQKIRCSIQSLNTCLNYTSEHQTALRLKTLDNQQFIPAEDIVNITPASTATPNKIIIYYIDIKSTFFNLLLVKEVDLNNPERGLAKLLKVFEKNNTSRPINIKNLATSYQKLMADKKITAINSGNAITFYGSLHAGFYLKDTPGRLYLMPTSNKAGQYKNNLQLLKIVKKKNKIIGLLVKHDKGIYFINSYLDLNSKKVTNLETGKSISLQPRKCSEGSSYDGSNCLVSSDIPSGSGSFIYNNYLYLSTAKSNMCPKNMINEGVFGNGARHCFTHVKMKSQHPFILNGNLYTTTRNDTKHDSYYPKPPKVTIATKNMDTLHILSMMPGSSNQDNLTIVYKDDNRPEAIFQMTVRFVLDTHQLTIINDQAISYDARYTGSDIEGLLPSLIKKDHLQKITPITNITNGHGYRVTAYLAPKSGKLFYLDTDSRDLLNAELVKVDSHGAYFAKNNNLYYQEGYFLNGYLAYGGEQQSGEPQNHHLPKPKQITLNKNWRYAGVYLDTAFYQDTNNGQWYGYNPDNRQIYDYNK